MSTTLSDPSFYAEYGEDRWLWERYPRYLRTPRWYVDVGAEQDITGSNTRFLDQLRWKGVLIDADPLAIRSLRTRGQHVVNAVVSSRRSVSFEISQYRGLSRIVADGGVRRRARRLDDVLRELEIDKVDLLSVDVEGHELDVLASSDLERLQPAFVIAEYRTLVPGTHVTPPKRYVETRGELLDFFRRRPYRLAHTTEANVIFVHRRL